MKLEAIMVGEVIQASPEECIAAAAKRMRERGVGCLVATVNGAVKGIVTDRDLLACLAESHDPYRCQVALHMRRPVFVLRPEEDHVTAAKVLRRRRIKRLPVAKNGRLLGIVSLSDLAALANEEAGKLQASLDFFADVVNAQAAQSSAVRPSPTAAAAPVAPQGAAAMEADFDASELIDAGGPG
jgi:signal-transduction protein with cAMP-binding, CBS, and nucleotidyltransferase domain